MKNSKKNKMSRLNKSKKQVAGANNNNLGLKQLFHENNNDEIENNIEVLLTPETENDMVVLTNNTEDAPHPSQIVACDRRLFSYILRLAGFKVADMTQKKGQRCIMRTKQGKRCSKQPCKSESGDVIDIICPQHLSMLQNEHPGFNFQMNNIAKFYLAGQKKNN